MPLQVKPSSSFLNALVYVSILIIISSPLTAQTHSWLILKNKKLVTFDWNCTQETTFPHQALSKIVNKAIAHESLKDPNVYGNRAFKISLQNNGAFVYFVPTVCGATGNCTWRLYKTSPVKYLGEIAGQYIYTYQSMDMMPMIVTYSHFNAAEGHLHTFQFRKRKYKWRGDSYPIGKMDLNGYDMPDFLKNAPRQCKEYGW